MPSRLSRPFSFSYEKAYVPANRGHGSNPDTTRLFWLPGLAASLQVAGHIGHTHARYTGRASRGRKVPRSPDDVTGMLADMMRGDRHAVNKLTPIVYDRLHRLARHYMRHERMGHTLQPTALVNEALQRLEYVDRRQSQIVQLRFFGGLSVEEISQTMAISERTVKREWSVARAWLYCEIRKGESR